MTTGNLSVRDVKIAPVTEGKGRTFRAALLGSIRAPGFWEGSVAGDVERPCWALFAGSDQEMRPFVANAVAGRKVLIESAGGYSRREAKLELLKSARYEVAWQKEAEGSMVTVFLPDLFRVDPGMVDPSGAKFILVARREWLGAQKIDDADRIVEHALSLPEVDYWVKNEKIDEAALRALVPMAYLFVVYLDRRTRCPIYADGRFYLQLLLSFMNQGHASFARPREGYVDHYGFGMKAAHATADDLEPLGVARPIAFKASHEDVEKTLADETTRFFAMQAEG